MAAGVCGGRGRELSEGDGAVEGARLAPLVGGDGRRYGLGIRWLLHGLEASATGDGGVCDQSVALYPIPP